MSKIAELKATKRQSASVRQKEGEAKAAKRELALASRLGKRKQRPGQPSDSLRQ